jgi:hypothetical protein
LGRLHWHDGELGDGGDGHSTYADQWSSFGKRFPLGKMWHPLVPRTLLAYRPSSSCASYPLDTYRGVADVVAVGGGVADDDGCSMHVGHLLSSGKMNPSGKMQRPLDHCTSLAFQRSSSCVAFPLGRLRDDDDDVGVDGAGDDGAGDDDDCSKRDVLLLSFGKKIPLGKMWCPLVHCMSLLFQHWSSCVVFRLGSVHGDCDDDDDDDGGSMRAGRLLSFDRLNPSGRTRCPLVHYIALVYQYLSLRVVFQLGSVHDVADDSDVGGGSKRVGRLLSFGRLNSSGKM